MKDEIKKIALFLDIENVSFNYLKFIMAELTKYGVTTVKRAYTNWTVNDSVDRREALIDYAITPIQTFNYTTGKNSTDSALIIDAMDVMYAGNTDIFCIVSSDSDFTRLITRLREQGKFVIGMGENKTPKSVRRVCDKFLNLEEIVVGNDKEKQKIVKKSNKTRIKTAKDIGQNVDSFKDEAIKIADEVEGKKEITEPSLLTSKNDGLNSESDAYIKQDALSNVDNEDGGVKIDEIISFVDNIISESGDKEGYANFADICNRVSSMYPDYDPRVYGYKKKSEHFCHIEHYKMVDEYKPETNTTNWKIKIKQSQNSKNK